MRVEASIFVTFTYSHESRTFTWDQLFPVVEQEESSNNRQPTTGFRASLHRETCAGVCD